MEESAEVFSRARRPNFVKAQVAWAVDGRVMPWAQNPVSATSDFDPKAVLAGTDGATATGAAIGAQVPREPPHGNRFGLWILHR